jgi:hypothetical protein
MSGVAGDAAEAARAYIKDVRRYVGGLYSDIRAEHGVRNFTEDWWTSKTRECMQAIDAARQVSDADALVAIGEARETLTWARQQIGRSRYDTKGMRASLDFILAFIARGWEQEAGAAGAASEAGEASEAGRDARMDALLERMRALIAEYIHIYIDTYIFTRMRSARMCVFVCVCACLYERERDRKRVLVCAC